MAWFEISNISWLKKLAKGVKKIVSYGLPIVGFVQFIVWMFKKWWGSLIDQFLEKIDSVLGEVSMSIGFGDLNIPWAKINSVIPLTEMVSLMIAFQAAVVALIIIRWVRIVNPFMS